MKDYDHLIIWLDYFNSTLSRAEGRRIPLDKAVKSPTLDELCQAAAQLGFKHATPREVISNLVM